MSESLSGWSLPAMFPDEPEALWHIWRGALAMKDAVPEARWQEEVTRLRSFVAVQRDAALPFMPQHKTCAELVEEMSEHLPERRKLLR